jgi:drug/metabolite transporter (DMT)-like permease
MMSSTRRQLLATVGLLCATFAWGAAFLLVKMTIAQMNLYFFLSLRFSLATLLMFLLFSRRIIAADRATIRAAFILSLFIAAAFITQTEGLRFTSVANSALITCLYMVFIPLFSFLFQGMRAEPSSVAGALFSFAGMYLLTSSSLTGINIGDFVTLLCAIVSAWHFILTGHYARRHPLVPLVAYQFLFTALFCGAIGAAQHGITVHVPPFGILTILLTAIFATVLAFLMQTFAQRVLSPTRAGVICSMEAVFGAAIPWTLGFEQPTLLAVVGGSMMVAGMLLSELAMALQISLRRRTKAIPSKLSP